MSAPRQGSQAAGDPDLGAIAQLVERLNGIQEVSGSIPLTSTNLIEIHGTKFGVRKDFDSSVKDPGNSLRQD